MFARLRPTLFIIMIPVLILAAGCSPAHLKLSKSDNGRHVTLHPGDQLVIELESNPSTGYTWEVVQVDPSLLAQQGKSSFQAASTGLVGAPGIQTLTFKALKAGSATLTLGYLRSWETGVPPVNTFQVTVGIQ